MTKYLSTFKIVFGFVLILFIAYWQIAFLQFSVKWDMIDVVLPWRYFSGECMQNGIFPFWNPYQQMGYPFHADLQYPLWNPEQLIISLFFGYNNYTIHFLFIGYLLFAAYGMYLLAKNFNSSKSIAITIAIGYVLTGFMVAHVQSLTLIIGATWIPYIIHYYLKMMSDTNNAYQNMFKTAFFLFIMLMSGYQALSIILAYFLLILFLCFLLNAYRNKNKKRIIQLLKLNLLLGILAIFSLTVIMVLYYQVSPYLNRFSGMPLKTALFCPLSPQSLVSLLIPFTVTKNTAFFNTDVSMANGYMGMIILLFFVFSLFIKKTPKQRIFIVFGFFCLLIAMGEYLPFRALLYYYVPMMDMFRFPSVFSLFTIICFLPISGYFLTLFFNNFDKYKKTISKIALIFVAIVFSFLIFSITKSSFSEFSFFKSHKSLYAMLESSLMFEHIFIHSSIQLFILGLFFLIIFSKTNIALKNKFTIVLLICEMVIAVQLNIFYTGVSKMKPNDIYQFIKNSPKGFPIPDANDKIIDNTDASVSHKPLWRNTNIFNKSISYQGYSSFYFQNFNYLFDSVAYLKNAVLNNPLLYLSDKMYAYHMLPDTLLPNIDNKNIYADDSIFKKYKNSNLGLNKTDTVYITEFSPNRINAVCHNQNAVIVNLLQTNYTGWQVFVDNKPINHFTSNYLFISAIIPKGKHEICFKYSNQPIIIGFIISYATLLFILIGIFWHRFKKS